MAAEVFSIEIPINATDNTDPGVSSASKNVSAFDRVNERTQQRLEKMRNTKYRLMLEALDKASLIIGRVGASAKALTSKTWRITLKALDMATAPIRGILRLFKNPLFQIGATIGLTIGLKDTLDTYADFEATISKVRSISGASMADTALLSEKAKKATEYTKFSATEVAQTYTYMAMAGWDATQMLQGLDGILALSAADGLDAATTTDIVTDALTAFGLSAEYSAHFADVLATASSSANTNVQLMGESFQYVAPIAGALKYNIEDVSLALGLMASSSVKGSMAGTSLKTALANMSAPTNQMAGVMQQYGISLMAADGSMRSLKDVLDILRDKMGSLSEVEKTAAASTLFGKEAMSGMLAIINASQSDYDKLTASIYNANGAAQSMSDIMNDNLKGDFLKIAHSADRIKIAFIEELQPKLRSMLQWLLGKMPNVQNAVIRFADKINDKIEWLTKTIQSFTSTPEWENADLFGKIRIAWDKVIAEPFSQWWEASGKAWFAEKARMIGEGIGSGLTMGLMALLGMDVTSAAADGLSIGASFADGFSQGFDGKKIGEAFINAFQGVVRDAGTLLPGGEQASSTSGLSAALLGYGGYKVGKAVYNGMQGGSRMLKGLLGKGGSSNMGIPGEPIFGGGFSTSTMQVAASAVYINGPANRTGGNAGSSFSPAGNSPSSTRGANGTGAGGAAAVGGGSAAIGGAAVIGIALEAGALATLTASDKATMDRERDYKIEFIQSFDPIAAKQQLIEAYQKNILKVEINKMFSSVGNDVAEQMLDKMFAGFSDKYSEPWFYWGSLNQSGLAKTLGPMIGALSNPHASGGIMTRPHMGLVAEAGPESIIPLSAARRDRGLDLWEQTGRLLGVLPYAGGGVPEIAPMRAAVPVMSPAPTHPEIKIEVSVSPTVQIQGGTQDIAQEVNRSMKKIARDMADVICNEVARSLSHLYTNKPAGVRT